jgi:putative flippase GtrA
MSHIEMIDLKLIFKSERKEWLLLARFLMVGLLNSLVGYSLFAGFLYAGLHYTAALFFATVMGVLFNFKSTGKMVFKSHNNQLIFRFVAVYLVCFGVNVAWLKLVTILGLDLYNGAALAVLPMALLAFVLNRKFVFHGVSQTRELD